jgi:hypothetical protein
MVGAMVIYVTVAALGVWPLVLVLWPFVLVICQWSAGQGRIWRTLV